MNDQNPPSLDAVSLENSLSLLMSTLVHWWEIFIGGLPHFFAAISVIFLFFFLAKGSRKVIGRLLPRVTKSRSVIDLGMTIVYGVVILVGFFTALSVLNLDRAVTSLLAGAGVIGLAIGFAFQEIAANFVSGILIAFQEPYQIGDIIEIQNCLGTVSKIDLRTTSVITFQGLEVIIPNKTMFTEAFVNYTTTPRRRIDMSIGVSYSDNLAGVDEVIKQGLADIQYRIKEYPIEVYFKEFGESSINFEVYLWIHFPGESNFFKARHEMVIKAKKALDEAGYTIPFPIRTLEFNSTLGKNLPLKSPSMEV